MEECNPQPGGQPGTEASRDAPETGYPDSVHATVTIAAPLLAAAALTLTGVVAADELKFRWPGVAMLCFMLAAASLVASVQFGFRASVYRFTEDQLKQWFVGAPEAEAGYYKDQDNLNHTIATARNTWEMKVRPAVYTYNLGTVLLGLGLSVALLPKHDSEQLVVRWVAMGLALALTIGEFIWVWNLNVPHAPAASPPPEASPSLSAHADGRGGAGSVSGVSTDGSGHRDA